MYDSLGMRLDALLSDLEFGYWLVAARTRPMLGAREGSKRGSTRGIPMAVVSNCRFSESVLRQELSRHDLAKHFAFIMVSAEYAARKPSLMLFEAAAKRLGVVANHIWFVGDSLDMADAKAAGMRTLWFSTSASSARPVDHSCSSWHEVVSYFDQR